MSVMTAAFARKPERLLKRETAHSHRPASEIGRASPKIQRREACACGGGCPDCKTKSGLPDRREETGSGPTSAPPTQLTIGAIDDPLEEEADRLADQVGAAPTHSAVTGAPSHIYATDGVPSMQRGIVPPTVHEVLR